MISLTLLLSTVLAADIPQHQPAATESQARINYYNAPAEAVEAWRQWKFGMHVQWNMSSLKGGEIGWSRGGPRHGGWPGLGEVPAEVYDNLYKEFKAEKFNARELCEILKDAGMRFTTFCNKHHDGFCMWDTKLTDYKVTSPLCPVGRDLTREWAEACRATGLKYALYVSQPDWHHPDAFRSPEAHARFIKTLHGWVRELCTNYGTVDAIEFDGLGGIARNWDSENLFKMIRQLQPNTIINSRCGAYDVEGWLINGWLPPGGVANLRGFPGDFDTPEQTINRMQTDRPWETCCPIHYGQWSWSPSARNRSFQEILHMLINVVGRDGNLMLCAAIRPDGTMEPAHREILRQCGQWLRKYGESIYETRGGPYYPTPHGVTTYRDNKIFVHILQWPSETLVLPPSQRKLIRFSVLTGGKADVVQDAEGASRITVPNEHRQALDTIVVLELDGPAKDAKPGRLALGSLATGKKVRASNVYSGLACFRPENAIDDDSHTRWATDFGTKQAWLEVDLGEEKTFDSVLIQEDLGFVRRFEVQYQQDGQWKTALSGATIGPGFRRSFEPVKARLVRLNILDAVPAPQFPAGLPGGNSHMNAYPGPAIWEFQIISGQNWARQPKAMVPDVFLDDLPMLSMKSGNEVPEKKTQMRKNCIAKPLCLAGVIYERGIGDHAGNGFAAELVYALKPQYKRFVSLVGIDDQTNGQGSVVVKVVVDGKVLLKTPVLCGGQPPEQVDVPIPQGAKQMKLVIEDAGDGYGYDDADFPNAGFVTSSDKQSTERQ